MKVLIADDHVIIRRGLKFLLDSHFGNFTVFETDTSLGVLELMEKNQITHLILDMQLQDGNIMEIFQDLRKRFPDAFVLIYTMSPEEIFGKRMLNLGATGFLNKQSSEEDVLKALELFFRGKRVISPALQDLLNNEQSKKGGSKNPFLQLSDREIEVLNRLLRGEGVKEIADSLEIKPNTVATFKARLYDKLGVSNLIDLQNIARLYNYYSNG